MTPLETWLARHWRAAADRVFLIGSTPWEVDDALVEFGFVAGPFESEDALGFAATGAGSRSGPLTGRMLQLGKIGRGTGAGWYRYPGGGGKVEDPIVADLALEEAHFGGLMRTDYDAGEIVDRIVHALVCAGVDAVVRGLARTGAEVDAAAVVACGFPATRGGPLCEADSIGVPNVIARLDELAKEDPCVWWVPDLLRHRTEPRARLSTLVNA